ncbi:MAG TPA: hypothetical protein VFR41_04260, partial [Acidimicrobiia bacterium]|nr:hypothetical protein [Acidimicrobiia bacterium]
DALVPPEIMGLTVEQIEAVPWRVPQWGEGTQVRVGVAAWVVESGDRRLVLDPMMAADGVLHDPAGEQDHQRAIAEAFERGGVAPESIDTVVASHLEGIGMIAQRSVDGLWQPFFTNARVLISEAALGTYDSADEFTRAAWRPLFDDGRVDTFADGEEIVPGMRTEVSGAHNPGHTVFHFGAAPDATFVGHLAVSPLHLATGLCPQQHPEPERAEALLRSYVDDGRVLIGPLWPSPGAGRWKTGTFTAA